jgi:hypothetical protein
MVEKTRRVKARTKTEAERVGKYLIRPLLSLERHSLDEREAQVSYRYGQEAGEMEWMDYLEFLAGVVSHIPDKGQVTVRYYGLYANAHRGKVKKASLGPFPLRIAEDELRPITSQGWAEMIRKVYEVDPMVCPLLYFLTMVEGDNKAKIRPHPAELKNQITII